MAIIIGAKRDGLILFGNVAHLVGMEEKVILVVVYNLALLLQGRRIKIIRIKTATFPIVRH